MNPQRQKEMKEKAEQLITQVFKNLEINGGMTFQQIMKDLGINFATLRLQEAYRMGLEDAAKTVETCGDQEANVEWLADKIRKAGE